MTYVVKWYSEFKILHKRADSRLIYRYGYLFCTETQDFHGRLLDDFWK